MPAQITHIVFTDKIFNTFFPARNKRDFFIGTCFPDIRFLKVIAKEKTHPPDMQIKKEDSDFLAGVKFHNILDNIRENHIIEQGVYEMVSPIHKQVRAIKVFEDSLFYNLVKTWPEYISYFNDVLPEELNFEIHPNDLRRWHDLLQEYFSQQPTPETSKTFMLGIGATPEDVVRAERLVAEIKNNFPVIDILKNFYQNFENILLEKGRGLI